LKSNEWQSRRMPQDIGGKHTLRPQTLAMFC
jgi:hypothetical protein